MDCKAMATPVASNLKIFIDALSETVDATIYHYMIFSLMFVMNTRTNTCCCMNDLNQFLMDPRHAHLVAKHAVKYLKGTFEYGIKYDTNKKTNLHGYVDSEW